MGAMDFVMTQGGVDSYLANFSEAERAFFTGIPIWAVVFWGLSILSALAAAIMILRRRKLAVPLFALSMLCFAIVAIQNYLLSSPSMNQVVGPFSMMVTAIIFLSIWGFWYYSERMRDNGVFV